MIHSSFEERALDQNCKRGIRASRLAVAVALGATPVAAALLWSGCSDETSIVGPTQVDPGGTFGAELSVVVVGRGRVLSSIPGINCPVATGQPGACFATLVFPNNAADGARDGVVLKAIPTPGTRFRGFRFEPTVLPTRGRGPDECNPISRAGAQPAVDPNAAEIKLDFGETQGSPPPGKEGLCVQYATVPYAYRVVATFEDILPEAGVDAGPGEVIFEPPAVGAGGREIGVVSSRLYWRFEVNGLHGIATGFTSGGATPTTMVPASNTIYAFDVGSHVVWQTGSTLQFVSGGSTSPITLNGGPLVCDHVTSDATNIYCQTNTALYSWTTGGVGPQIISPFPAAGEKIATDTTYFYFANDADGGAGASTIYRLLKSTADAGIAPTPLVTGQTNPIALEVTSSRIFWINYDAPNIIGELQASFSTGGTATTAVPSSSGLRFLQPDPSFTTRVWAAAVPVGMASNSRIMRGESTGGAPVTVVQGINGLGGFTIDSSFIYWTQGDGRVRRTPKL